MLIILSFTKTLTLSLSFFRSLSLSRMQINVICGHNQSFGFHFFISPDPASSASSPSLFATCVSYFTCFLIHPFVLLLITSFFPFPSIVGCLFSVHSKVMFSLQTALLVVTVAMISADITESKNYHRDCFDSVRCVKKKKK